MQPSGLQLVTVGDPNPLSDSDERKASRPKQQVSTAFFVLTHLSYLTAPGPWPAEGHHNCYTREYCATKGPSTGEGGKGSAALLIKVNWLTRFSGQTGGSQSSAGWTAYVDNLEGTCDHHDCRTWMLTSSLSRSRNLLGPISPA